MKVEDKLMHSQTSKHGRSPWAFFALTYGWTWLFWLVAVATGRPMDNAPVPLLVALGGVGPMAAALILLYTRNNKAAQRNYWRRVFDFRRIGPAWWGVIFLFTPLLTLAAVGLDAALSGQGVRLDPNSEFLTGSVVTLASSALFALFFGPVPEELGWRGYALERLQARHGAILSSLILGVVWAAWHLPLFFIPDSYQAGMGVITPTFWRYMLSIIPETFFITWISNHTRRSTLAAILFHFVTNFNPVESIFALSTTGHWVQFTLRMATAVAIVALGGMDSQDSKLQQR